MGDLLDVEKYLLIELAYFHLPSQLKNAVTPKTPMPLDIYLDLIDQCSFSIFPAFFNQTASGRSFVRQRQGQLRRVYAASDNLGDVVVIGYVNDNYGPLGNTKDPLKTSFVALAFADSEGNGLTVFSGCEQVRLSNLLLDWGGCLVASLGINTRHHRKALNFYDQFMGTLAGERNILGHSKGGNLATYVFINRLEEPVSAYCVNAQPYCWFVMRDFQREALKSDRFEYIVHAKDPTRIASYVPYISRTAPLNRYASQRNFFNVHGLTEVNFDDYGNLEGARVIRETKSRIKTCLFRDFAAEKRFNHDECLQRLQNRIGNCSSAPRLFSTAIDEMLLVTDALAAILWLRDQDADGGYIYPLIVKSPQAEELYKLRLYPGQGLAARCAFEGLPFYIKDAEDNDDVLQGLEHAMNTTISSEIVLPLGLDEAEVFGALELINKKNDNFSVEDFALVSEMTLAMLEVFQRTDQTFAAVRDFTLLRVRRGRERLFSIEKHAYKEVDFADALAKNDFLRKITGENLSDGEVLIFNRRKFSPSMQARLKNLRQQDYGIICTSPKRRLSRETVEKMLESALRRSPKKGDLAVQTSHILKRIGLADHLTTPVCQLTDEQYLLLEYGIACCRRPMLIILDLPLSGNFSPGAVESLCRYLHEDCRKKTATAIVLRLQQQEEAASPNAKLR
jgi:energy-coupling factor transporter ATP-binding protein EcfA2